jgi:hypothetical protein
MAAFERPARRPPHVASPVEAGDISKIPLVFSGTPVLAVVKYVRAVARA